MNLIEAVKTRKTIRAFKSDPLPQSVLREILDEARNSPSWGNTQPWEFAVVTGSELEEIKKGYLENGDSESAMEAGEPPQEKIEPYLSRSRHQGQKEYELLGISHDDKEGRAWWRSQNFRNYGAPCVIYSVAKDIHSVPALLDITLILIIGGFLLTKTVAARTVKLQDATSLNDRLTGFVTAP